MDIDQFVTAMEDFIRSQEYQGKLMFTVSDSAMFAGGKQQTFTTCTSVNEFSSLVFDATGAMWAHFGGRNE